MPDVWPLHPSTLRIAVTSPVLIASFGDGYEQRATKAQAYSHADLQGAVTSHKAQRRFDISYDMVKEANGDATQEFNKLAAFVYAHWLDSFYFYNRVEQATIDLTGVATVGRYLVRLEPSSVSLENFFNKLFRASMTLIEVRA